MSRTHTHLRHPNYDDLSRRCETLDIRQLRPGQARGIKQVGVRYAELFPTWLRRLHGIRSAPAAVLSYPMWHLLQGLSIDHTADTPLPILRF
ncbi:hypothetical protein ACG7TL_005045 [Trametes sanguinea]